MRLFSFDIPRENLLDLIVNLQADITQHQNRSSHWRCSVRKGILRNFAKFLRTSFLQNTSGRLILSDLKDIPLIYFIDHNQHFYLLIQSSEKYVTDVGIREWQIAFDGLKTSEKCDDLKRMSSSVHYTMR